MPNTYFQFKQFTVQQKKSALKVSTDSCLFGAWIADALKKEKLPIHTALDIGAGTGLLMLMLAQQCKAVIDGIELDGPSYDEATENIQASPWKDRLQVIPGDVKEYSFEKRYDLIFSNPPFYEGDLKSAASNRNVAMHDTGLKLQELIGAANILISENGSLAVLLPYQRSDEFITNAGQYNFYLIKRMNVQQTIHHPFFRSFILLGRTKQEPVINSMAIKNDQHEYTDDFIALLKEYYLYL